MLRSPVCPLNRGGILDVSWEVRLLFFFVFLFFVDLDEAEVRVRKIIGVVSR